MEPQVMHVKKLTLEDLTALEQMNTGIDDDYIIRIYDRLIASNTQELFGLFQDKKLVSIGGYSLFGNKKFAMIGRLRSDRRYQSRGYSTELLIQVMEELHSSSHVKWIGANTHVHNLPTRRVLEKIGLESGPTIHYLTLTAPIF
ncbi:GNAT family N-acetyltransferase [Halobacillus amylolyticus]|uniref:GNAT family N-acetyltransferase n=1 Tax=Halobacillus amylolyticus TaxID=2932259 RepID=A0ABY4HEB4_9BACI|nr:GNAT family N-acetyltransferase [Halobacillus amylolyticus]UOR11750.1 GNAT family N-acetyltransferase [Halobacillus amylolyticus]